MKEQKAKARTKRFLNVVLFFRGKLEGDKDERNLK